MYDPAEDSWTAIASMMVPRCEFGLCAVDGRLYAFGGWVGEDIGQPVFRIRIQYDLSIQVQAGKNDIKNKEISWLDILYGLFRGRERFLLWLRSPSLEA